MDSNQSRGTKRSSIGKKLLFVFVSLFALLLVAYFVVTSSAFLKGVILPKVSAAIGGEVKVEDATISPFSSVTLKKLTVKTTGTDPVIAAEEVRAKYSLMDIIRGNINVSELALISPTVNIVNEADGSSNLDPLLKKDTSKEDSKAEEPKESSEINIANVSLQNGTIRQTTKSRNGGVEKIELAGLNVNLDKLGTGQKGKLTINSGFSMDSQAPGTNNYVGGKIEGGYDLALNKEMKPEMIQGSTKLSIADARGAFANYAGVAGTLQADVTPTEIKAVVLQFAKGETNLGQVRVSGPFDMDKTEGRLSVEMVGLDKNLLNFAGAANGMDFRNSTFNTTNVVELTKGGNTVAATGGLLGSRVSVVQNGEATPEINLNVQYQVNVDRAAQTAVLRQLQVSGLNGTTPFLRSSLDAPMHISFGGNVEGAKDATLTLVLTNFNLAAWKPVIGTNVSAGVMNANMRLASQQDGKLLKFDAETAIANLAVQNGTNLMGGLQLTLNANGTVEQMKLVNISQYQLNLQQEGETVLKGNGFAKYNLDTSVVSAQITSESALGRIAKIGGITDLEASSGVVRLNGNFSDDTQKKLVKARVDLAEWTGKFQEYAFNQYGLTIDSDLELQGNGIQINKAILGFAEAGRQGGALELTGKYDQVTTAGQFVFKTEGLNEAALRPFLAPSLGEKKLVSINFAANGSANLDPDKETAIKTDLNISNLVVDDPSGSVPREPLGVKLSFDGGKQDTILNIRQMIVGLTPTARAKNELRMQALLDLNKAHPKPSTLALTSEGMDVTTYYNLFSGDPAATNAPATTAKAPTQPTTAGTISTNDAQAEPEPITLPFGNLAANIKFDRFYLRNLAITNMVVNMTMSNQVVGFPKINMNLNGGMVDGVMTANVGVPGYQYDVNLKVDNAPLEPLATSFSSTQPGTLEGLLLASIKIKGAGTSGRSLKQHLNGDIALAMTNMNYQVVGPKWRKILVPVAAVLQAPEMLQTPINFINSDIKIGEGNIHVEGLRVASEAFFANVHGVIQMDDVLTNSPLNLPVELSLRRSLAAKIRMLPANTPEDAKYAPLPTFVSLKGTVGDPTPDINKTAIALSVLDVAKVKEAGQIKNALNALTGQGPVATGTNAPAGNKDVNKAVDILQGVKGIFGGAPAQTNNPPPETSTKAPGSNSITNQPAGTNNPPAATTPQTNEPAIDRAIDLFNRFKKK